MEAVSGRSSSSGHGGLIKEENRDNSNGDDEEVRHRGEEVVIANKVGTKRKGLEVELLKPLSSSPKQKHFSSSHQVAYVNKNEGSSVEGANSKGASSSTQKDQDDYELESAKAELGEVREENQRLRVYLDRTMKDYQTLQMKFQDIVQLQSSKRSMDTSTTTSTQPRAEEEQPEFVSLSLGRSSSTDSKKVDEKNKTLGQRDEQFNKHGLALGLDCKFEESKMRSPPPPPPEALPNSITISPENSSFEEPREEASETTNWPPNKILQKKTMTSGEHEEILQQNNNNVKKARVSVRARCDTPTMNDGCQWRKYGQKIAKGNPCPRAYYRCTVAPSCPVRKQVQRCAQDMSILITTYEGTHNHPLPIAATAMATTTSAAASMLLSGSSSSRPGGLVVPSGSGNNVTTTTTTGTTAADQLHGLNFYLSENSKAKQFYFPNTSISSSSPSSYPTVTLDLTSSSSSSSSFASHFNNLNRLSSSYVPPPTPRFSSLNFSSSESNTLPISWSNGQLTYGNTTPSYNKNTNNIASINLGTRQPSPQESNFYQSYMQKNNHHPTNITQQQSLLPADTAHNTIAAATKAITSDPTFQSALAAALTSIIGASPGNLSQLGGFGENFGQKLKWGDQFLPPASSSYQSTPNGNGNGCGSSYMNTTRPSSSSNPQSAGSLMFLPPSSSLPFSSSKSASTSPSETRDQSN